MEFKKQYTSEELAEVIQWLNEHREQFPESLQLRPEIHISSLSTAVDGFIKIAEVHSGNPNFGGQILWLFEIRDKLKSLLEGGA